jgi:hypothetical protein
MSAPVTYPIPRYALPQRFRPDNIPCPGPTLGPGTEGYPPLLPPPLKAPPGVTGCAAAKAGGLLPLFC